MKIAAIALALLCTGSSLPAQPADRSTPPVPARAQGYGSTCHKPMTLEITPRGQSEPYTITIPASTEYAFACDSLKNLSDGEMIYGRCSFRALPCGQLNVAPHSLCSLDQYDAAPLKLELSDVAIRIRIFDLIDE